MARIFITGAAEGLGAMAATGLLAQGHQVVVHARNAARGRAALAANPGAEAVLLADLSDIDATIALAREVHAAGAFDAIIHNAGVYQAPPRELFTVNTLAPYLLTCLVPPPRRLIYLSSGMHLQGRARLDLLPTSVDRVTYSDTKLQVLLLCKAVARKWAGVAANAVDPGWVPTRMGGPGAPDDLQQGVATQVWLAAAQDAAARVSGQYFYHLQPSACNPEADDPGLQERFLDICAALTGIGFPDWKG